MMFKLNISVDVEVDRLKNPYKKYLMLIVLFKILIIIL